MFFYYILLPTTPIFTIFVPLLNKDVREVDPTAEEVKLECVRENFIIKLNSVKN